jgi:hypothetical protein
MASVDVENVAWAVPSSVPVPRVVAPSKKVTVPLAVPIAGGVAATVAVKVTVCPQSAGCDELLIAVVVDPLLTICGEAESVPVLVVKLVDPL